MDEDRILLDIIFSSSDSDSDSETKTKRAPVRKLFQQRNRFGALVTIIKLLESEDSLLFYNYMRMTPERFEELLAIVGPGITKLNYITKPISAKERLAVTIRFLASGESQKSLSFNYMISPTAVNYIIYETNNEIWKCLKGKVFPKISKEYLASVAKGFEEKWNLPNCVGSIDGKHITMQAPKNSGSRFFNYKKNHSIVLLALCDHNYNFIMCDIGASGRQSDGGVFVNSTFGRAMNDNKIDFPSPRDLSETCKNIPYYVVGDDEFALNIHMMKPYAKKNLTEEERIFNYILSRSRRTIENAFGILSSKWRIFRKPIISEVHFLEKIVCATVCLHNWLRNQNNSQYVQNDLIDFEHPDKTVTPGTWRQLENNFEPMKIHFHNAPRMAKELRDKIARYLCNEGAVEWQWKMI